MFGRGKHEAPYVLTSAQVDEKISQYKARALEDLNDAEFREYLTTSELPSRVVSELKRNSRALDDSIRVLLNDLEDEETKEIIAEDCWNFKKCVERPLSLLQVDIVEGLHLSSSKIDILIDNLAREISECKIDCISHIYTLQSVVPDITSRQIERINSIVDDLIEEARSQPNYDEILRDTGCTSDADYIDFIKRDLELSDVIKAWDEYHNANRPGASSTR